MAASKAPFTQRSMMSFAWESLEILPPNFDASFSKQNDDAGLGDAVGFSETAKRPALLVASGDVGLLYSCQSVDNLGR